MKISQRLICYTLFAICTTPIIAKNTCQQITGSWAGTYTDHGPYGTTMPLEWALQLKDHSNDFVGTSIISASEVMTLPKFSITGSCDPHTGALHFYLLNPQQLCGAASEGQLKLVRGKWQISAKQLHWENAMTGGQGPLLMHKANNKVINFADSNLLPNKQYPSCH